MATLATATFAEPDTYAQQVEAKVWATLDCLCVGQGARRLHWQRLAEHGPFARTGGDGAEAVLGHCIAGD